MVKLWTLKERFLGGNPNYFEFCTFVYSFYPKKWSKKGGLNSSDHGQTVLNSTGYGEKYEYSTFFCSRQVSLAQ